MFFPFRSLPYPIQYAMQWLTERKSPIRVMAGGGITTDNIAALLAQTGVLEVHGSFRKTTASPVTFRPSGMTLGDSPYTLKKADPEAIKTCLAALLQTQANTGEC
jgi:copper homeostasis protein CutC